MLKELITISENLHIQDNRITSDPIFVVQQLKRDWGYDEEYAEDYKWANNEDFEEEADDGKVADLQALEDDFEDTKPWFKCYYKERWEFVTPCFTEKAAQAFIDRNRHNMGKARIYVESGCRNLEFRQVREYLLGLTGGE